MLYLLSVLEREILNIYCKTVTYAFLEKKQEYAHEFTLHAIHKNINWLNSKMLQQQVKRQVHH